MFVVFASACNRTSELVLRDTEGRTFSAACQPSGACKLGRNDGKSAAADKTALALHAPGRLVGICDVAPGSSPSQPSDCRALVCEGDRDCPPAHGLKQGHCLNGFCVDPSNPVSVPDAVMLCLAGTGLGRQTASQVERFALAQNCGSPCIIPRPCRQL